MSEQIEALALQVDAQLAGKVRRVASLPDELAYEVAPGALLSVCRTLRDAPEFKFELLMDVAGVDYLDYGHDKWQTSSATRSDFNRGRTARPPGQGGFSDDSNVGTETAPPAARARYMVAYQLLSLKHNRRVRLRAPCEDDEGEPVIDSVVDIWASANWFEREAFDLFGILFRGHPDLRRILTDYGFIGHPFRKDFPLIGNVEVRYDVDKKRVVYEPVSIEPRVLVPKVIRDDHRYEPAIKQEVPVR